MGPTVAGNVHRLIPIGILLIGFITCATVADAVAISAPTSTAVSNAGNNVEPKADEVVVGAYVENIQTLDLATNSFMADIYVWMRWMNRELAPYESLEVMNPYETWALTTAPLTPEPVPQPDGSLYYAIRYQGAFNTNFDLSQFPFGEQTLRIQLEDQRLEANQLSYVLDSNAIAIDPQVTVPGYDIDEPTISVDEVRYSSNFGDLNSRANDVYSRVTIAIPVTHPFLATSVKVLLPLILVVITASLIFHVPPGLIEARIGLGITALLTLVAMQWSALSNLPDGGYLVMLDVLYIASFMFVLTTLIQTLATSWKAREGDEAGAIRLDKRMMVIDLAVFVAVSAIIMWAFLR
jgi:hypothetical protein